jgi:aryl-alcohol dehydrogenase
MATRLVQPPPTKVIAVDVVPERLELARKFGATDTINCRQVTDLKAALLEATGGEGIDGSIDATGRPEVAEALLRASAKKGSVVQVGVGQVRADERCAARVEHADMVVNVAHRRGVCLHVRYCQ